MVPFFLALILRYRKNYSNKNHPLSYCCAGLGTDDVGISRSHKTKIELNSQTPKIHEKWIMDPWALCEEEIIFDWFQLFNHNNKTNRSMFRSFVCSFRGVSTYRHTDRRKPWQATTPIHQEEDFVWFASHRHRRRRWIGSGNNWLIKHREKAAAALSMGTVTAHSASIGWVIFRFFAEMLFK